MSFCPVQRETVEIYSPERAAQVRQKFNLQNVEISVGRGSATPVRATSPSPPPPPVDVMKMSDGLEKLGKGKIPDAVKDKMIALVRAQVAKTEDPLAKTAILGVFAAQMSKMGEQETALQLMNEAESFASQNPINYLDFMQNWMLASGYAQVAPEKAFPILEDSIYRLNETVSAFVKVAAFMDVSGEIIENGEVQVGTFGGGMIKQVSGNLGQTNESLKLLADADFARTKNLTNRFERTELRVLARLLILRAVFSEQEKNQKDGITSDGAKNTVKSQPDRP